MAEVRPQEAAWLTVDRVAQLTSRSTRTVRRQVARWFASQWPRVRRVPCRGDARGEYLVEPDSFDRFCAGEPKPEIDAVAA